MNRGTDPKETSCSCGPAAHPAAISNPPGLDTIAYRVGDYTSFREALLRPRAGETQLASFDGSTTAKPVWRPSATGDLAVQLIEWWAYLADVLTFYNERAANEAYLRAADLPASVSRLVRLLGYRPRPGIGATGTLAALANGSRPFTLPAGFPIQSKPGPGSQPQVFELKNDVTITPSVGAAGSTAVQGAASVEAIRDFSGSIEPNKTVLLAGTISAVQQGDRVLILPIGTFVPPDFAVATVAAVAYRKDPLGSSVTQITLGTVDKTLTNVADLTKYRLLRSNQTAQLWQYPADTGYVIQNPAANAPPVDPGIPRRPPIVPLFEWRRPTGPTQPAPAPSAIQVDLMSLVRSINPGDPIVFEWDQAPQCGVLTKSTELIWFANPAGYTPGSSDFTGVNPAIPPGTSVAAPIPIRPWPPRRVEVFAAPGNDDLTVGSSAGPSTSAPFPMPIPHTRLTFPWTASTLPSDDATVRQNYLVRYGWQTVGPLIVEPLGQVGGSATAPLTLQKTDGTPFDLAASTTVLVEDVNGSGAAGIVATTLQLAAPVPLLVPPLRALFNLLPVTRGQTVANEVLGSGNPSIAGQDFMLQKAPVTYLANGSTSGPNFSSTVRVRVNQIEWAEVQSFFNQPPNAQVFVTREDGQGNTHVVFGDGVNGALLPTGVNNVVATYRYGSGAVAPAAATLTVVLQPQPGLRAIRNPVAVTGGADPDAPDALRQLAPRSVLTFDRAVSVDDFEAIAAQTAGVSRAKAAVAFDPLAQRPRLTVWVGDDAGAVTCAMAAFNTMADPNRLPLVKLANKVIRALSLTVVYDRRYDAATVLNAVHAALLDPNTGVLGVKVVGIGQVIYDSMLYAACLSTAGVTAVHSLRFEAPAQFERFRPEFKLFVPPGATPISAAPATCSGQRYDPGANGYLFLPDDPAYLTLNAEAAS